MLISLLELLVSEGHQLADSPDFETWKRVCKNTASGSPVEFRGDKNSCVAVITKDHLKGPHEMGSWDGKKGKHYDKYRPLKEETLTEGQKQQKLVAKIYSEVMSSVDVKLSDRAKKAIKDGISDAYEAGEDAGHEAAMNESLFEAKKKAESIPPVDQYPMQLPIDADAVYNAAAINKFLNQNSQVLDMLPNKSGSADYVFVGATAKALNMLWDEFFASPYKEMRIGRKPPITKR